MNKFEAAEHLLMFVFGFKAEDKRDLLNRVNNSLDMETPVSKGQLSELEYWDVKGKGGTYRVITNGSSYPTCTCPDWQFRFRSSLTKEVMPAPCKHGLRVLLRSYGEIYARKERPSNGRTVQQGSNGQVTA